MRETGTKQEQSKEGGGRHKGEEVPVITAANAVVEPHAVMVKRLNTVVAYTAMVAAGRTPDTAGLAVLHRHIHGCNVRCRQLHHHPVVGWWANRQRIVCGIRRWQLMKIARNNLERDC